VSRTDKTRPYTVQYEDPHNRRLRIVGNVDWPAGGGQEWTWKKIDPCSSSCCCYGYWFKAAHRKNRAKLHKAVRNAVKSAPQDRAEIDIWYDKLTW
jgi:hypothetical protein